jgi:hypothetical protein
MCWRLVIAKRVTLRRHTHSWCLQNIQGGHAGYTRTHALPTPTLAPPGWLLQLPASVSCAGEGSHAEVRTAPAAHKGGVVRRGQWVHKSMRKLKGPDESSCYHKGRFVAGPDTVWSNASCSNLSACAFAHALEGTHTTWFARQLSPGWLVQCDVGRGRSDQVQLTRWSSVLCYLTLLLLLRHIPCWDWQSAHPVCSRQCSWLQE